MHLIDEVEVSYFRSFYKFRIKNQRNLNIIFGKNDSGKSNLVRALNLFFTGDPDHIQHFDFDTDFCDVRKEESTQSEDVRKFLYVKITFKTPPSYLPSLGNSFYVKRQWTVSRGRNYHEEVSSSIPTNRRHIVTRFLNKIRFIYIPAIKDISIFEILLSSVYETISSSGNFNKALEEFTLNIQELTGEMFSTLPDDVSSETKISAPTRVIELFRTLDFETKVGKSSVRKSLTRQRGDGIKARHIPELLNFISTHDSYDFHIWGFEEPENSLDFVAAELEANRFVEISKGDRVQIFLTTHSPSFYNVVDDNVSKTYVFKNSDECSEPVVGKELEKFDPEKAIGEGFYLPAVSEALRSVSEIRESLLVTKKEKESLQKEINEIRSPVVLVEGRTDEIIIGIAWDKLYPDKKINFKVKSCETSRENIGSGNGGVTRLANYLKSVTSDNEFKVIGFFDHDEEGISGFKLDRNFVDIEHEGVKIKKAIFGRSYAFLLPCPDFRNECASYQNLPIEFLFPDEFLCSEIDGVKLELETKKASLKVGDKMVYRDLDDELQFKKIVSRSKMGFAKNVVPNLPKEAFIGFSRLFRTIDFIINISEEG